MEKTLYVTAHPDDFEVMLSYHAMHPKVEAYVLIASLGEGGENLRADDPDYVSSGRRVEESDAALRLLNIPLERRLQLNEPDGKLVEREDYLVEKIVEYVKAHGIKRLVSLGEDGYDGHTDHITTHLATRRAIGRLAAMGIDVEHEGLNANHEGQHRVPAAPDTLKRKVSAMALHESQYLIAHASGDSQGFIAGGHIFAPQTLDVLQRHMPLVTIGETYDPYPVIQAEDQADKQLLAA